MKQKTFLILMAVLALILAGMLFAVFQTISRSAAPSAPEQIEYAQPIEQEDISDARTPDGLASWQDSGIEVGTLTYTITRATVVNNITHAGPGGLREGAAVYIYGASPEDTTVYFYAGNVDVEGGVTDDLGNLIPGASMVVLDIRVDSVDAVNFITDPETGVQDRRYEDNPFLFRADEIAYIVDTGDQGIGGRNYYDAVYFSEFGKFDEHPMAYELLPGEIITFRVGYLLGNRTDGTPTVNRDLVASTEFNVKGETYFDLNLT